MIDCKEQCMLSSTIGQRIQHCLDGKCFHGWKPDETVEPLVETYSGWIRSIRNSKDIQFLSTYDGLKEMQVTVKPGTICIGELKVGASFTSIGTYGTTPRGFPEFVSRAFEIVGKSDDEFVIQPKFHSHDFLRSVPELRGRTLQYQSVWKIRHHLTQAIHRVLEDADFFQYYAPIVTTGDCEGAGETLEVRSKDEWLKENLTVSAQLHGEIGMMSLGKIYTFGPCFRAEKSKTVKHLTEFWMVEPEMAFYDLEKTVSFVEEFVKSIMTRVLDKCPLEFKHLGVDTVKFYQVTARPWTKLRYVDVCQQFGLTYGEDVSSELEKKIVTAFGCPVFITHFPKDMKPFYMKKDEQFAQCFDLIFPEVGELVGGSEREDSYEVLKKSMEDSGMLMEKMDWYLSTRKWGSVPHAGFGMGFERLLMYLTKMPKVHDTIPFPIAY